MGEYTELNISVKLKNLEADTIKTIKYMIGESEAPGENLEHPLFQTDRWEYMLRTNSTYFSETAYSELLESKIDTKVYVLNIKTDFKNYKNEAEYFLNWIKPYIFNDCIIGYMNMTAAESILPIVIYRKDGKIFYEQLEKETEHPNEKIFLEEEWIDIGYLSVDIKDKLNF